MANYELRIINYEEWELFVSCFIIKNEELRMKEMR